MNRKWSQTDANQLGEFLDRNPNVLAFLKSQRPPIIGETIEQTALRAHRVKGYEEAMDTLTRMAQGEITTYAIDDSIEQP